MALSIYFYVSKFCRSLQVTIKCISMINS